jgi:MoaA/NifB/PqqE/SkfB family radical SAM enzyme
LENFDYLADLKKHKLVSLNFALQNKNYKDVTNFIKLCHRYGFRGNIHQLDDWGTWSQMPAENKDTWTVTNGIFSDHDILNPNHPNYKSCQDIIAQNLNSHDIIFSSALLKLINK